MSKLLRKPSTLPQDNITTRYEFLNLKDNPFPAQPVVDKQSNDPRINGNIFEIEIRRKEFDKVENNFIKEQRSSLNHLRLGYILDTSYIGRGNGKSAFLIQLNELINKEFCLDISDGNNKCFGVYVSPEPGGRCKSFSTFIDSVFNSIINSNIIETCLATLTLEAIYELNREIYETLTNDDDLEIVRKLNDIDWYKENSFNISSIIETIMGKVEFDSVSSDFPLYSTFNNLLPRLVTKEDFKTHYIQNVKKVGDKIDFLFSDLVCFFQAANFNGAYLLIDDFERIPDFQSARQRKDFAIELRTCLFDGFNRNTRYGFYTTLLVLHAGVPGLISDAWSESGLENRIPISPKMESKHLISFEKLSKEHAILLIRKYLYEYRINANIESPIDPFTEESIGYIGQLAEYNASSILKYAYQLIEIAAENGKEIIIDKNFVEEHIIDHINTNEKSMPTIDEASTEDLLKKSQS